MPNLSHMPPFLPGKRYLFFLIAALLLSVGIILHRFGNAMEVNRWSTAYLDQIMNSGRGAQPLSLAPQAHGRAVFWLAQDALSSGDPRLALDMIQPLLECADPILLSLQGNALAAENDFEGAVDVLIQAGDYRSLLKVGSEATSAGLLEDAEMAYRGAWGIDPLDGTLPLANFLLQINKDPAAAEHILRQSLDVYQPPNLNWIRSLGNVLRAQSRWDEALSLYQQALDQKSEDLYTLRLLGEAYYLGKEDPDKAYDVFQTMLALAPEKGDGYFAMGRLLANEHQYDEAEQWFIQALERNPDDPWWWVVRANTTREAQNLPGALDIYTRTVLQYPEYAIAYYEMAWAYKLDDQPEQAIRAIEQALAQQQTPIVWYYVRAGTIYEWVGDKASALDAYRRAIEITPPNQTAIQTAENALNRLNVNGE